MHKRYDKYMGQQKKTSSPLFRFTVGQLLCLLVIASVILMIVPVSVALSAGIAGLSIGIFGASLCMTGYLFFKWPVRMRPLAAAAFVAALFGFIFPQTAYLLSARRENVGVSFNPVSYFTFSGATTIQPTRLITYKSTTEKPLEIAYYQSVSPGTRPAVLLLHGGGWKYGSHLETGDWPRLLTKAGFSVFSVQYRLANNTYPTWRDAPSDVHDAYTYLQDHAESLAIDPAKISLLGQSAGGHLALLEAYLHNDARSVVSLYAPIDLALDYTTSRDKSAELDFIGGPPLQYPNRYRSVSPVTYVSPHAPPTLIIQGTTDDLVATQNATLLASSLVENRIKHGLVILPMTGHSFENQRGGFATQIAEKRVLQFLLR